MNATYIVAAWVIVFAVLAFYAVTTAMRGRRLAKRVPAGERRWVDATDGGGGDT